MQLQADLIPSIVLKIYDGNGKVENQIEDIEKLIQEKVDILIVSPLQSKPITPIVEKAIREGISVLIVDRKTEGQNYTAYLGADNYEVGTNEANKEGTKIYLDFMKNELVVDQTNASQNELIEKRLEKGDITVNKNEVLKI